MEWGFLDQLAHGKPFALILTAIGGAFAAGAALFKYLSDKRADKIIADTVRRLESERAEVADKKKQLDDLLKEFEKRSTEVAIHQDAMKALREAILGSEEAVWRLHSPIKPADYDDAMADKDPPVLLVANFKGGVGKTTIATNLAAHFSKKLLKRILVIDLDHQGSLSNMLMSSAGITDIRCDAAKILDRNHSRSAFQELITSLDLTLGKVDLISASPQLAAAESKLHFEYLVQEPGPDARYLLAEMLNARAVRQNYSLVILDCPPRLTPAAVNGFCAATHILVPTVLDRLSAEQVGIFLASAKQLKAKLNPSLDLLGVVGVMTDQVRLRAREKEAKRVAEQQMHSVWNNGTGVLARHIPHKAAIQAAAGRGIAYKNDKVVASWFDKLGAEIAARLGLGTTLGLVDESQTTSRTTFRVSGHRKSVQQFTSDRSVGKVQ